MKPVQYERIMANSDFHVLNLTHVLLYRRSNSPLVLVTLYCMELACCLCRTFFLMLNFDPWSHFNVEKINWNHMLCLKFISRPLTNGQAQFSSFM